MKKNRTPFDLLILAMVGSLIMVGCTRSLLGSQSRPPTPSAGPTPAPFFTTPTAVPGLPTPFPTLTPTATPEPVDQIAADPVNDGVSCQTGAPISGALPPEVDIGAAWVEVLAEESALRFTIRFHRLNDLKTVLDDGVVEFLGGIELLDPGGPAPIADGDWYFNQTGNISFNFGWNKDLEQLFAWKAVFNGQEWEILSEIYYPIAAEENRLEIQVPLAEVPPGSQWLAVVTNFEICDVVGLEEGQPVLPLQ